MGKTRKISADLSSKDFKAYEYAIFISGAGCFSHFLRDALDRRTIEILGVENMTEAQEQAEQLKKKVGVAV